LLTRREYTNLPRTPALEAAQNHIGRIERNLQLYPRLRRPAQLAQRRQQYVSAKAGGRTELQSFRLLRAHQLAAHTGEVAEEDSQKRRIVSRPE
jgi:hypothetical protein